MTQFNPNISEIANRKKIALFRHAGTAISLMSFAMLLLHLAKSDDRQVDVFEVPGAFEIPLRVKQLAETEEYAGIVAAGLVVDGGIYRHEFVATAVIDGLMRAQMDTGTPVFFCCFKRHMIFFQMVSQNSFLSIFFTKGIEVAQACAVTLNHYPDEQVA